MKINEIFSSIQGEGPYSGTPATFIRVTGCVQPYCKFCDTAYSWKEGKDMPLEEIMEEVKYLPSKFVVVTGGEPYAAEGIYELLNALMRGGYATQTETSGKAPVDVVTGTTIVCSPKWYDDGFVVTDSALKNATYFKFVVGNDKDFRRAKKFILDNKLRPSGCYLMPLSTFDEEKDREIRKTVWDHCVRNNINYSPRLHVEVFGKKRGV